MTFHSPRINMSRRGFFKTAGAVGAAGMLSTGSWLKPVEALAEGTETVGYTYHNEHCMSNCMLKCTVRDGRLVMVQPRPNEDNRFHNVCLKGIAEIQNIYGEARLQSPMKRVGERGSGKFEVITWDEAFQMIAENFKAVQDKYGKNALWIQYSTEAGQRFAPLLASVLGAQAGGLNGYDMGQGNGQQTAFAWSGMFALNTIWEWPKAKVVIMANLNMLETGMMWSRAMLDAKEAGTKFITLDPRFSTTASKSDIWVNLRAGTDPAFFLGMTKYIIDNKLYAYNHLLENTSFPFLVNERTGEVVGEMKDAIDETGAKTQVKIPYVWDTASQSAQPHDAAGVKPALEGSYTVDGVSCITEFELLKRDMADYTLEWTAETCDISQELIAEVATLYAEGPSIISNGVGGIDKFYNNDIAGHCYALIASLTGNYGKRGTGCGIYFYHVTRFEAALGGWALPKGAAPAPSPKGFYDVVKTNDVHAAMFFGDIPTQKAGNWNKTLEWLDSLDFVCLADIYRSSVTDYCDLVLPVCSKFECADEVGGVKCANAQILANLKVLDPLFESKSDFYIEKGIADAMGFGHLFPKDGTEYAKAVLNTPDPQVKGITLETLKENNGAQWLNDISDWLGPEVGMRYHTPSGKQEPYYEYMIKWGQAFPQWEAPIEAYPENPLREKYPLQFSQARSRFRVHSAYSGAQWIQQLSEPHIELNKVDAEKRGLKDGDKVEVFNDRGSFRTTLRINEAVRPESAFMVESTYRQYLDGTIMQSVSNDTMNPRGYDMMFGPMTPFNDTLIEIKKAGK